MTRLEAINLLTRRAKAYPGQSDPYTRAILPPWPLEWATPTERAEWREMVLSLPPRSRLPPDFPVSAAVLSFCRTVAETLAPETP